MSDFQSSAPTAVAPADQKEGTSGPSSTRQDFHYDKHVEYIKVISRDKDSFEYVVTEHLRMSGVYWGVTAMAILGKDLRTEMDSPAIVDWVMQCYNPEIGG
jgi:geranylgeranyl transferase type-2 subunit beta